MFEVKVLSAFIESRKEHDTARQYVHDLSPIGRAVLRAVSEYYHMDDAATHVDMDVLTSMLDRQFGGVPKHKQELQDYLTELVAVDTSAVNVAKEILEAEKASAGVELADAILRKDETDIAEKLAKYQDVLADSLIGEEKEEAYTGVHLDELQYIYAKDALIRVAPPALNDKLRGGCIRGQHIVVAASPEAGKSLVALNMTSGFIQQDLKVLYVGNEDPIPELVLRLLSNLSGVNADHLFDDTEDVMERAFERGYSLVTFQGLDPGTIEEIDAMLSKDDYDVLVIDQLRNIRSKSENNTTRLEAVAQGARNLGRKHNVLVISVTQAADSGRDKLVMNMGDIDGSNVGIPGACDVMIMVGMNDDYYMRDLRRMTLVKNKRGGQHGNFSVSIDRALTRITNYGGLD
jgi:archaellum biogenesis ATPase FlaH